LIKGLPGISGKAFFMERWEEEKKGKVERNDIW
jgi:hypothetical protein